jgi:DNA-binding transcriptional regulator YdaS (Cro superfamily)
MTRSLRQVSRWHSNGKSDSKRWTQKAVAELLGVARETVRDWFDITNGVSAKANTPDARVKLKAVSELLGVSQPTVAAWFDITNISADKGNTPDARVKLSTENYGCLQLGTTSGNTPDARVKLSTLNSG